MARRNSGQRGGRRAGRDDHDEDRPRRGRAHARPSGGGSAGVIVGGVVAAVAVVVGLVFAMNSPKKPRRSRATDSRSGSSSIETTVRTSTPRKAAVESPKRKALQLFFEAKEASRSKDLTTAFAKCDQVIRENPQFAGDAYLTKATFLALTDQEKRQKRELYRLAIEAYQRPGAESAKYASTAKGIELAQKSQRNLPD